jgi:hypothetical protein
MMSYKLIGEYVRQTDGKTLAYDGMLEGTRYEVRVWPVDDKPHDIMKLPITVQGDLAGVQGGDESSLAHKVIGNFLEDWRPEPEPDAR